jgi:anti-anti-sigma regulatory factor
VVKESTEISGQCVDDGSKISVELSIIGSTIVVRVWGMLRSKSVAAFEAQADQLMSLPYRDVVLDVSGLTELDEVGEAVLVGLQNYVVGRGGQCRLVGKREAMVPTMGRRSASVGKVSA